MAHLNSREQMTVSKAMSRVLRHGAVKEGYTLAPGGFVPADELRAKCRALQKLSDTDFLFLVDNNAKKRFRVRQDDGRLWIAANQGHSFDLPEDEYLEPITDAAAVPVAVHGTYSKFLDAIKAEGLSRMTRQHVHFAVGTPGDKEVISGMRKDVDVFIFLDVGKALAKGLKLYRSENNVILTPGDSTGHVPPDCFLRVVPRSEA